jgi:hypothetical protein
MPRQSRADIPLLVLLLSMLPLVSAPPMLAATEGAGTSEERVAPAGQAARTRRLQISIARRNSLNMCFQLGLAWQGAVTYQHMTLLQSLALVAE